MKKSAIKAIRLYQLILSPDTGWLKFAYQLSVLNPTGVARVGCRNTPRCSEYAIRTINNEGVFRGVFKTIIRLIHCY